MSGTGIKQHPVELLNLWRFWPSKVPYESSVCVLAWTWYDARMLAMTWFNVSFDALQSDEVQRRHWWHQKGDHVIIANPAGHLEAFETTRAACSTDFRRKDHARKWRKVALEGRRPHEEVPPGVQVDGQPPVRPEGAGVPEDHVPSAAIVPKARDAGGVLPDGVPASGPFLGRLLRAAGDVVLKRVLGEKT